jgi:hypothetical protein
MELARKLKNFPITVNAMHPGAVATNIINNDPDARPCVRIFYSISKVFFRNPREAAKDILYLALSEEWKNTSGAYFIKREMRAPSEKALDKDSAGQLWEFSENLTNYRNVLFTTNNITLET